LSESYINPVAPTVGQQTEDWWSGIDGEILSCLAEHDTMTPAEIGSAVGVSEGEAVAFLAMLASEGKVTICQVKRGGAAEKVEPG
jgi:hypothetical protein